jgi:hypothetical protein
MFPCVQGIPRFVTVLTTGGATSSWFIASVAPRQAPPPLGGRCGSADIVTTSPVRLPLFALLRTIFLRSIGLHQLTFLRKNPHNDFQIGERGN